MDFRTTCMKEPPDPFHQHRPFGFLSLLADQETPAILANMQSTKYIIWEEEGRWHGYLEDYPDIPTQGESFEDLQVRLSHLKHDLSNGEHDRCHNPPSTMSQPNPRRTKAADRLERILSTMLNNH